MSPTTSPENWWPFREGEERTIAVGCLSLRVDHIFERRILATMTLDGRKVAGAARLDQPIAMCRDLRTGEVLVAMTLRRVIEGVAYVQISHSPAMLKVAATRGIQ